MKRVIGIIAIILVAGFLLIQLVPYGHSHTNPPVTQEPAWPDPETRTLAQRACFDCHSNQTDWLWYTNVAPFSWLIQHDVDDGRRQLNFSEWNRPQREARGMARTVQRGTMPRWFYLPLHPEANLSAADKATLISGLQTIAASAPRGSGGARNEGGEGGEGESH